MVHEFDTVALLMPLSADRLFPSELPEGVGLVPGDTGVIVDAMHAPAIYTVEFFREGMTVAIADVTPDQIRLVQQYTPAVPEPAHRIVTH
jgi:hypothetical protein